MVFEMTPDPIVEEVRAIRDAFAAQFGYDLKAICQYLREQQRLSGRTVVDFSKDAPREVGGNSVPPPSSADRELASPRT